MLTVGGIIFDEGSKSKFEQCHFNDLEFIRDSEEPYVINVPKLTLREIQMMNTHLPTNFKNAPKFLSLDQKSQYKEIYPYFPHFMEAYLG